jgi:hypothetical protein
VNRRTNHSEETSDDAGADVWPKITLMSFARSVVDEITDAAVLFAAAANALTVVVYVSAIVIHLSFIPW